MMKGLVLDKARERAFYFEENPFGVFVLAGRGELEVLCQQTRRSTAESSLQHG